MPEIKTQFSFLKNLLKTVVLAGISAAVVFGNFMLEGKFVNGEIAKTDVLSGFDYEEDNIVPNNGIIRFAEPSFEDGGSESGLSQMDVLSAGNNEYIFKFNGGKFWGNFSFSNARVNILVGDSVVIIPDKAVFSAEFVGNEVKIGTYDGDVYLGFLGGEMKLDKYTDQYGAVFMNRFVVPRDSQATIYLDKVDKRLAGLLYSRMFTEFKRSSIPDEVKKSEFVKNNKGKDKNYLEELEQKFLLNKRFQGNAVSDGRLADFVYWAEENLTFMPEKKEGMIFDHLFAYLDQAIFYADEGNAEKVQEFLGEFSEYRGIIPESISSSEKYMDEYYERINSYIDELSIFNPNDRQYDVYKFLLDQKFNDGVDQIDVTNRFWLDIYKAMNVAPGRVKSAVENYYKYLNKIVGAESLIKSSAPEFYKIYVSYQDQLFENLFFRYSMFYQDVYFAIKTVLEQEILSLYDQGQLRTELSQDFISRKIDFIRRLMNLFFDQNMDVQAAKDIVSRLIEEINDLMPPESTKVAVIALFESQLNNLGDFWGYLNSAEYNSSKAYGLTHRDRYAVYLKDRDKIWSFANVTDAVLGVEGVISNASLEAVKTEISDALLVNEDVKSPEIGSIKDPTQRHVGVKFVFGGYPVTAIFDRYDKTLKSVYVFDQLVSEDRVNLDELLKLMNAKLSEELKIEADSAENPGSTEEELAQHFAKLYIANKIKVAGFKVAEDQIMLVDDANIIYRVEKLFLWEMPEILVTFDYLSMKEKVANLYFVVDGTPIVLSGEYTLAELHDFIVNNEVESKGEVKKTQRGGI